MKDISATTGYGGIASGLLASDALMPSQHTDLHRSGARTGEQRLALAILELSLRDYGGQIATGDLGSSHVKTPEQVSHRRRRFHNDAEGWLQDCWGYSAPPYSFEWCCEMLDYEVGWLRAGILSGAITELPRRRQTETMTGGMRITAKKVRIRQ